MVNFGGVTNKVPLSELFEFTVEEISQVLEYMGISSSQEKCTENKLDRFVFLNGDDQEVYNSEERSFIESVGNIYIFREFHKKTKRGTMPCRIIAAAFDSADDVKGALFFMKEITKAIGGFTIYFLKVNEKLFLGMRTFNRDEKDDCLLSRPLELFEDFDELSEQLSFVSESDSFIDYYSSLALAIECPKEQYVDYDEQITLKRGIQFEYLQMLNEIEEIYHLNFVGEKNRYYQSFEKNTIVDYKTRVKDAMSELQFVESFKANTMEFLFEAEEMAQLAAQTEEENIMFVENNAEVDDRDEESDTKMKEYLDDPEMMIKILRQQKGI